VQQRGRVAALLELGAGFHPDLTGRENVYLNASVLGLTREETEAQFDAILEFSGVAAFIDTQVKFYSSGMYVRLAFAIAVHTDPDILLVDEVLAVGDEAFQKKCLDKIKEFQTQGRTIILVSHALDQIQALCDRVVVMNRGQLVFDGVPVSAVARFRELLATHGDEQGQSVEVERGMRIERIELLDTDGARVDAIEQSASFVVRVHVEMLRPIDDWAIGFSIDAANGQLALASNTGLLEIDLGPLTSSRSVDIVVDGAKFTPGDYYVNANVAGLSDASADSLMQGAAFTVIGSQQTIGPVAASVAVR
jgi:ABC-2 type transport system ATP-binding protein